MDLIADLGRIWIDDNWMVKPVAGGLINRTWKLSGKRGTFILQQINASVFKDPPAIARNIVRIAAYLKLHNPDYFFPAPLKTPSGEDMVNQQGEWFRLFPYVAGSSTLHSVHTPAQAYEAAAQFGRFSALLTDFPIDDLTVTIPGFHDLALRYRQFLDALEVGNKQRIAGARSEVETLLGYRRYVDTYHQLVMNPGFRTRVIHHDTKISNVLFDQAGKAICVIDLDTVMPGFFISDLGDMIRTYVSSANEEERDPTKVAVDMRVAEAVLRGYLEQMGPLLTDAEKDHVGFAGYFMVYMQALRFMTDYLCDDPYYGERYPEHNLVRTRNQLALLNALVEKEQQLSRLIEGILAA